MVLQKVEVASHISWPPREYIEYTNPYHVEVRIRDAVYSVSLHDGTVIKPVGITVSPAMVVHASGYWSGNTFIANRIVVLR